MILDPNILQLDIKVQDKYRKLLSKLGQDGVELKCVQLGDSDIDYELSPNMESARILNAPYNVESIKYPLIYNGAGKGLKGTVSSFVRLVNADGTISSLYNYPTSSLFETGRVPPSLENGKNFDKIDFTSSQMGVIIYFQTLLDYYFDIETNLPLRLKEEYDIVVTFSSSTTVPTGWEITIDQANGSMLLGKAAVAVSSTTIFNGKIEAIGKISSNKKTIEFNY